MAHVLCVLNNWGYRHTLRICNTYCFSTATMVAWTRLDITFIRALPVLLMSTLPNTCTYGTSVFQHAIITVELGRNNLGLCETSDNTLYTLWYQLLSPKAHVFLPQYDIHKSIYLRYNNIASHRFQCNFPISRQFWELYYSTSSFRGQAHYASL